VQRVIKAGGDFVWTVQAHHQLLSHRVWMEFSCRSEHLSFLMTLVSQQTIILFLISKFLTLLFC